MKSNVMKHLGRITTDVNTQTTADRQLARNLLDLSALMETISTATGKISCKKIRMNLVVISTDTGGYKPFKVKPLIIQTAGTFTSTANINMSPVIEAAIVDSAINDEFGYQNLSDWLISKIINVTDDSGLEYHKQVVISFDVPRNIINLLNKQASTERLQEILVGLIGLTISGSEVLNIDLMYEIDYTVVQKGITIR